MTFKGHSLRFIRLGLFAVLLLAAAYSVHAQSVPANGSWRIVIVDNLTRSDAQEAKRLLDIIKLSESSYIEQTGATYRVTYGDFATQAQAEAARKELNDKEKMFAVGVVQAATAAPAPATPAAAGGSEVLTIFVRDFTDQAEAEKLKLKLETQFGSASVMIRRVGNFYEVFVGQYDADEAAVAMGQIRQMGFTTAQVRPLPSASQSMPAMVVAAPAPPPAASIDDSALPIAQEEWNKLTEEQKQKVRSNIVLQAQMRKGDPVAPQIFDMKRRIESLDEQVKRIIQDLDAKAKDDEKRRQEINTLVEDAENLIKSRELEKYKEARLKLDQAYNLDPKNLFGQKNVIQARIAVVESLLKGLDYPGQDAVITKTIKNKQEQIDRLRRMGTKTALLEARSLYSDLIELDPNNQKAAAEKEIGMIDRQISDIEEGERAAAAEKEKQNLYIIYGLGGAVGLLFLIVLAFGMRSRKRHQELMRKVQEITSIRPMRELEGSGPQLLGGTESDIFTPGASSGDGGIDPLGGVLTPPPPPDKKAKKKGKGGKETPVAAAAPVAVSDGLDDIFGGGDAGGGMGGDGGLDDIFGAPAPAPAAAPKPAAKAAPADAPTVRATEAPTAGSGSDIDDIFGGLFADESSPGGSAPAAQPAPQQAGNGGSHDTSPISFADFHGAEAPEATAVSDTDLLSVFEEPASGKSSKQEVDPLQDSPFVSMFSDGPAPSVADTTTGADDSEIPSIKLDKTHGGDTTAEPVSFGGMSLGAGTTTPATESLDLPTFSFDDLVGATSVNVDSTPGAELDFEQDQAGQIPPGWSGEYPFARLTVEADTPPRGAQQYLCFNKGEGAGKAHYSYRFGEIRGKVGIEFDMRCNDKNKFLLGFYIEKNGDFQQSIHTKILRSEAQTSPTIHMQGQSAPYLLGSWAHIKYVVDLTAGKINGYIDSTHVVRDLPLTPNPGSLNTLSIRDNINTKGVLLLDNIRVYPVE